MDLTYKNDKDRFGHLCNNQQFADIYFIFKNDKEHQRIPAHKLILSVGSDVFKTMFFGSLPTQTDEIEILDVEPDGFKALLKYLYSQEVQINPEIVMSTLYAAKKYNVAELELFCVDFLEKSLTANNAFLLLNQARFYDELELAESCLKVIEKNTREALDSDCFIDIDLGTLIAVLERKTLQVFESDLFEAIFLWSKVECVRKELPVTPENQRTVLGRALSLILYPLMTFKKFANGPVRSRLLTDIQVTKFCMIIASKTNSMETPRCSTNLALAKTPEVHLKFNYLTHLIQKQQHFIDSFAFSQPVVIVGFALHTYLMKDKSKITLTLKDSLQPVFDITQCNDLSSTSLELPIILSRPFVINSSEIYTIETQIEKLSDCDLAPQNCLNKNYGELNCVYCGRYNRYQVAKMAVMEHIKPLNMNSVDYFNFIKCSGIISQIIFYEANSNVDPEDVLVRSFDIFKSN
ncbi:BTB/POZ domain-containing protein 2-like [Chrysoperla carnea]|uniref:BTB/POZ domain-containing protein 2-like n=1 Tax=Chrysoperla carnea TaxID=189513 RepID=UPI001D05CD61|nr:BTB/POZ domain-containing protein 2-like [Chrysoperla carnea]